MFRFYRHAHDNKTDATARTSTDRILDRTSLSLDPDGIDRDETIEKIGHNDTPEAIVEAISSATAKGWLVETGSRLKPTDAGLEQFQRAFDLQQQLHEERMQGISEAEFVTAIRVMQRTIENVGGNAWHW